MDGTLLPHAPPWPTVFAGRVEILPWGTDSPGRWSVASPMVCVVVVGRPIYGINRTRRIMFSECDPHNMGPTKQEENQNESSCMGSLPGSEELYCLLTIGNGGLQGGGLFKAVLHSLGDSDGELNEALNTDGVVTRCSRNADSIP